MDESVICSMVPTSLVRVVWPLVLPYMKKLVKRNSDELTLAGIYSRLNTDTESMIIISRGPEILAAITIQVQTFDTGKKALCVLLGGGKDHLAWIGGLMEFLDSVAIQLGCYEIRGLGCRVGWAREATTEFFTIKNVTLKRDVIPEGD